MKTKPVMPLTSLGDNNMLAGLKVVNKASPSKIAAKAITINPTTRLSVFINSLLRRIAS